jgi:hypothetical protein
MIDEVVEENTNKGQYPPETLAIITRLVLSCKSPMGYFEERQGQQEKNHPFVGYDRGDAFVKGANGRLYTCFFSTCISKGLDGFPHFWDFDFHLRQEHELGLLAAIQP